MNEPNLDYLKKSLDYLGFGLKLNDVLESAVRKEIPQFSLGISQHYTPAEFRKEPWKGSDHMRFELNFNKSRESGTYYLNSYQAILNRYNNSNPVRQVFDLERDNRMTALQAYKLLAGFSFEKEIYLKPSAENQNEHPEKRSVWFKLNPGVTDAYGNHPLHRFYPEYRYDLEQSIDKYPFVLDEADKKDKVIKALRNGGLVELDLSIENKSLPVFVSADPQFKTLNIYNREMQRISDDRILSPGAQVKNDETLSAVPPESGRGRQVPGQAENVPWKQDEQSPQNQKLGR